MAITKATASSVAPAAKGDLVVGSGTNDAAVLAVGSANQVLTVDSSTTTGLKWAAAAGGITSASARVDTAQSTSSTTFTDLATSGPAVTLTTGTKALVILSAFLYSDTANVYTNMGYAVSGASSISASNSYALQIRQGDTSDQPIHASWAGVRTVTAGSNTFTAKYSTGSNASYFEQREIIVIDLGS